MNTIINNNYGKLPGSYLFAHIRQKVDAYLAKNPNADIIRLGIGDVTKPLTKSVIDALHHAVDEMGKAESFRGYGPEQGYDFLIDTIIEHEYTARGIELDRSEVFVSDGSKCDVAHIQELFSQSCRVAIGDPVYPVYLDSNVMAGRTGELGANGRFEGLTYLECTPSNGFAPSLPSSPVELIYLCSPNNPTGTVLSHDELTKWVRYAKENNAVIMYDSAYSAYIRDSKIPRSIYEIEGAKEVAIEFKSFSKTAGFTGLRCAFCVVPKELKRLDNEGNYQSLNEMWNRHQSTMFNGVSYVVQRAAQAVYSKEGLIEIQENVDYYMENARIIREGLILAGYEVFGGENAPYIWWRLPEGIDSMEFLDILLESCQVVGTPGVGFGPCGQGFFRLTAFGDRQRTLEAIDRISKMKIS